MVSANKVIYQNGAIREFAKPEVCEAIKLANADRWTVGLSPIEWYEREARLKKELEEHANAPVSGKEKAKKVNPALKEAASRFNDALLAEQGKQIDEQNKEITRLDKIIRNKNEELRLTRIREKNLAELGLKYVGENEKLKKKLADKIVDEIDARALKMIRKMAKAIVGEKPICPEDFKEYRRLADGYMSNPQLPEFSEEEEKKLMAKTVGINAKCMRAARESINDVFESYAAKYAKSTLDELKDRAYESFNAKAHKFGLVGSRDGKGIPDQRIRVDIAEELSKVPDNVIDQFLLSGGIIIKEEK